MGIGTREIVLVAALLGFSIGGAGGYYIGYDHGWERASTEQKATVEENPFADIETNPLQNVETNPLKEVKTNPFE